MEELLKAMIGPAVVAAVVSGAVALATHLSEGRRAERERKIKTWAEAYRTYVAYKEFPFLVRRRSPEDPAAERLRLSSELSKVQQDLAYYCAWAAAENPRVGALYEYLVAEARRVAGRSISEAWDRDPPASDGDMHVRDVDLGALQAPERLFRAAVHQHLHPIRSRMTPGQVRSRREVRHAAAGRRPLPIESSPRVRDVEPEAVGDVVGEV